MSIIEPEIEKVDRSSRSIRYLEHGWPSDLCRWHAHEEYELHLVVETRGKAFVGDYIGDFKPGDLFMTGPNLPHNWITDQVWSEPVEIRDMLIQFSHESVEKLAQAFPEFSQVLELLQLAQSGIHFEGFNATFARGHMESIRDNKGNFQTVTGHSFVDFLNRIRIGQASAMLYASDAQITAIAQEAGFKNLANFNRHFLKVRGMTPSEYRETARKDLAPKRQGSS